MMNKTPRDLAQIFFSLIVLILLMGGSLYVLLPFLPALVWATMIVVSTWPLMKSLQGFLRGSRGLATTAMVLAMLVVVLLPVFFAVKSIAENSATIRTKVEMLRTADLPNPPTWLGKVPVVGEKAATEWQAVIDQGADGLRARLQPHIRSIVAWISEKAGSVGMLGLHLLLTIAIAGILYVKGEAAARGVSRFAKRLSPQRGESTVHLAGQAIRAVAMGIVVTAILQSVLGGLALAICGVPGAIVLTAVMFLLCIAQLGPFLVLAPAVGWLYWSGQTGAGTVLLVITLVVVSMDNIIRPLLIKKGADLPLLLIMAGVIGGLLAFGLVGLFVGPGLLAVAFTLLDAWVLETEKEASSEESPAAEP